MVVVMEVLNVEARQRSRFMHRLQMLTMVEGGWGPSGWGAEDRGKFSYDESREMLLMIA